MVGSDYSIEYLRNIGATSNVILLTSSHIYCANAGDSRSVISKSKKAVGLSEDHKPSNKIESDRIYKANHFVIECDVNRVDGNLALSRAFGDFKYKN